MPEPTASTSHTKLHSRSISALVVSLVLIANGASAHAQMSASDIAKARGEAQKLEKPLIKDFEAAEKAFKKIRREFSRTLPAGINNKRDEQKLQEGIEYRVYMLTNPKLELHELQAERAAFSRTLAGVGSTVNGGPRQKKKHQDMVFGLVVQKCIDLLDGNYYVRVQAINIMRDLRYGSRPYQPYVGSQEALLSIARTSPFPEMRLVALTDLARFLKLGALNKPEEMSVAVVMAAELMKPDLPNGTYYLLADWLQDVRNTFEIQGRKSPVAIVALLHSMNDESRSWIARAHAAKALGFTGDANASIKWELIAWKIAEFAHDAGIEFQKQQGGGEVADPVDREAMFDIILSMTPDTQKAIDAGQGILVNRTKAPMAKGAYDKILPVVKEALGKGGIETKTLDALKEWVAANKPADGTYSSQAPPLPAKKSKPAGGAEKPPSNTSNGSGKSGSAGE